MSKVQVPRDCSVGMNKEDGQFQLHVFADASKKAYAAAAFLRVETTQGVKVHLLQSKSRVAPLKSATIPRLELMSCNVAARLAVSVQKALGLENVPIKFWTDSTTALSWIWRSDEWGTFVGNRTKEICELKKVSDWSHIPGLHNPADLPSRGISPLKYVEMRWWEGPDWLRLSESQWPKSESKVDEQAINQERKKGISTLTVTSTSDYWYIRKGSYSSNLRIVAFVLRFVSLTRKLSNDKSKWPTTEELHNAEKHLFKIVQAEAFPATANVIDGLRVERDTEGIIRVRTKITHRDDTDAFRRPVLLPHSHPIVNQLIFEEHLSNAHGGAQLLMANLREKAWIVQGKRAIKKVLHKCISCKRYDGKKGVLPSCALPEPRVRDASTFEVTGIDLAGPLTLKNKAKVYIVMFTCAVNRCIHLELAESLSTESFLLAFTRFCKRRRRPEIIYSDNGTNFVGASNLFRSIDWDKVEHETGQHKLKWVFNPPSAPWWGGWWERIVRSVNDLLRRMLGFKKLSFVQLETALCEVESAVNHRPLTYVTEDPEDLVPLTPAMFCTNLPNSGLPEADVVTVSSLNEKHKALGQLLKELRDRFRSEYLGLLLQRGKELKKLNFRVGDVVLVEIDNQKWIFWPMARIIELMPKKDGEVRVAKLRAKMGTLVRPVQRLIPLEIEYGELPVVPGREVGIGHEENPNEIAVPKKVEVHSETVHKVTRTGRKIKRPSRYD